MAFPPNASRSEANHGGFTDDKDLPAQRFKLSDISFVAEDVAETFIVPKSDICGWRDPAISTAVHMPPAFLFDKKAAGATRSFAETAVNEDYFFVSDKDDIGMAGEAAAMKGVTITHSMNKGTNDYFRRSVPPKYARKILAHKDLRTENATLMIFEF